MFYLGIDPGLTGGIAAVDAAGELVRAVPMPPTEADLLTEFAILGDPAEVRAVLERVHAFPKMGVCSAFTFGEGYGGLKMALTAAMIRFEIVVPRKWQGALGCLSGRDKNVTKRRAQQLFPGRKVTHAIADAMLIAEFCRRIHQQAVVNNARKGHTGEQHGKAEARTHQGQGTEADRDLEQLAEETGRQYLEDEARRRRRRQAIELS